MSEIAEAPRLVGRGDQRELLGAILSPPETAMGATKTENSDSDDDRSLGRDNIGCTKFFSQNIAGDPGDRTTESKDDATLGRCPVHHAW